jgi:hypothetical protein
MLSPVMRQMTHGFLLSDKTNARIVANASTTAPQSVAEPAGLTLFPEKQNYAIDGNCLM